MRFLDAVAARLGRSRRQDGRGGRMLAVIECHLNQNVRDGGAATFPAMNLPLLEQCARHGVGLLPMPCPEVHCLGPQRARPAGTSLRAALDSSEGRRCCQALAEETGDRVQTRLAMGGELLAVLGGNPESPGCAVHLATDDPRGPLDARSGVFIQALWGNLTRRGIQVPFRGLRDYRPELMQEDLDWLAGLTRRGE
jgi:hypothetical protein